MHVPDHRILPSQDSFILTNERKSILKWQSLSLIVDVNAYFN